MDQERAALVERFWIEHDLAQGDRPARLEAERNSWAHEVVRDALDDDPTLALALLDDLILSPKADVVALGAGPLEDLLVEHGVEVQDHVVERCQRDESWRRATASVWLDAREREQLPRLSPYLRQ